MIQDAIPIMEDLRLNEGDMIQSNFRDDFGTVTGNKGGVFGDWDSWQNDCKPLSAGRENCKTRIKADTSSGAVDELELLVGKVIRAANLSVEEAETEAEAGTETESAGSLTQKLIDEVDELAKESPFSDLLRSNNMNLSSFDRMDGHHSVASGLMKRKIVAWFAKNPVLVMRVLNADKDGTLDMTLYKVREHVKTKYNLDDNGLNNIESDITSHGPDIDALLPQ